MPELAFYDGFYQADSLTSMNMLCQNMYPKQIILGEEVQWRLERTPGCSTQVSCGAVSTASNRGLHEVGNNAYAVNGTGLYFIDIDATFPVATLLGTVSGSGQVSMADNGTQLMVLAPGGNGYIYNTSTSTFSQITDVDFTANGNPQYVIFIDGYFMCSTDTNKFIISALRDGTSWNALDFGSAESDPDPIVGLFNFKNEAYIFGSETCEAFDNIGGADFPFQRNGLILDKGLSCPLSIAQTSGTFMWIGSGRNEQPAIYALSGAGTVKISNTAVDLLLRDLTEAQKLEVRGDAYFQDGSSFAVWSLPDVAICYDLETRKWHTRVSRVEIEGNDSDTAWRCINLVERRDGQILAGDKYTNAITLVTRNVYYEPVSGNSIIRIHDARPINIEGRAFAIPSIELQAETGLSQQTTTSTPLVSMSISRDAYNFTNERSREMGALGKRRTRVKWRRNGRFTDYAQFRFTMTDSSSYTVIGVNADVVVGRG